MWSRGFSERPKPRKSGTRAPCSVSLSRSAFQSYELDGNPWRKSSSGSPPSRRKRWMRRPRNSSSPPRSRQAATLVVRSAAAIAIGLLVPVSATRALSPLGGDGRAPELVDESPRLVEVVALLEGGGGGPVRLESLEIPRVELAQVSGGALAAEVLLRTVHHPEQLRDHLIAFRRDASRARQLLEDPGVAERSARDHHRVRARGLVGVARPFGAVEAAGDDQGHRDAIDQFPSEPIVGASLVLGRGRARVECDRRDACLLRQPQRQVESLAAAACQP